MSRPVVVVGDVGLDVIARPRGEIQWHSDTPSSVTLVAGGAGGNSASWLAAGGAEVTLLARIGRDAAGTTCQHELEAEGVRCAFAVDDELRTCMVVVLLDALARAREGRWTTSVDPQSAELVTEVGADTFLSWVDGVDLLLPNENEVAALGGLERILRHTRQVVATYGGAGARWVGDDVDVSAEAPHVTTVDATGCGDAFNAGLLASWLDGDDPFDALAAGVAVGSDAAGRVGARPS